MLNDFLNLPIIILCIISVVVGAGLSILALVIIRRKFHWELYKQNHEVGGFLFNALGLIYAVLVAFVVYATWNDYQNAGKYVDNEANLLQDLFLDAEGLPPKYQDKIRENIFKYLNSIINEEWNTLSKGEASPHTRERLIDLWKIYVNVDSLTTQEQIVYSESFRRLNDLTNYRRLRVFSVQQHIPSLIWIVIIIGAMTSIGFSLFFGTKNLVVQSIMTGLFAMTNALVLLLILVLDYPFTGDVKISIEPFQDILIYLKEYMLRK